MRILRPGYWSRANKLRALGNVPLLIGLLLWVFGLPTVTLKSTLLHVICGVFFGVSIAMNLWALRIAARARRGRDIS